MQPAVTAFDAALREGTGQGSDFTGWIDLPKEYDKEFDRILKSAEKIKSDSDVLICHRYWWIIPWCQSGYRLFK